MRELQVANHLQWRGRGSPAFQLAMAESVDLRESESAVFAVSVEMLVQA